MGNEWHKLCHHVHIKCWQDNSAYLTSCVYPDMDVCGFCKSRNLRLQIWSLHFPLKKSEPM